MGRVGVSEPLISLSGVRFAYQPGRQVLAGIDFQLGPGERVGLVGPNGSGKTTILSLILGLLRPTAGRIEAFGKARSTEADFQEIRGRVGLLFQDSDDQLFCPTVGEDVAFGPLNLGLPRHEVRTVVARTLERLGLGGYESRITYRLSGGEKRLAALATVLAMDPEALLLDEPTAGLDDEAVDRVSGILAGLPQAMLLVSHQRTFLDRLTHRTCRLASGRLWELSGRDSRSPATSLSCGEDSSPA
jgi:cobalt/nickel transport system ATP-binding protein